MVTHPRLRLVLSCLTSVIYLPIYSHCHHCYSCLCCVLIAAFKLGILLYLCAKKVEVHSTPGPFKGMCSLWSLESCSLAFKQKASLPWSRLCSPPCETFLQKGNLLYNPGPRCVYFPAVIWWPLLDWVRLHNMSCSAVMPPFSSSYQNMDLCTGVC